MYTTNFNITNLDLTNLDITNLDIISSNINNLDITNLEITSSNITTLDATQPDLGKFYIYYTNIVKVIKFLLSYKLFVDYLIYAPIYKYNR